MDHPVVGSAFCTLDQPQADDVEALKLLIARGPMTQALQRRMSVASLMQALIESAANCAASAIVQDGAKKALCSMTDEGHAELLRQRITDALTASLADARPAILQPPTVAFPTHARPS